MVLLNATLFATTETRFYEYFSNVLGIKLRQAICKQ